MSVCNKVATSVKNRAIFIFEFGLYARPIMAEKRILWINPVGTDEFDREMEKYLEAHKNDDTEISVVSFEKGPANLEYYSYSIPIANQLLSSIKWAESNGFDAAIIGCFYDPFLDEMREVSSMIIAAPAESSMKIASSLGDSFSIIVGRKKWVPKMAENVRKYGYEKHLVSFRSIEMGVNDFQRYKEETEKRILRSAREAVERDGAEVVILGCTAEFGFYRKIQEEIGVPVVDAVVAPLKFAEFMVDLKRVTGIGYSRVAKYQSPPIDEAKKWLETQSE